jgi:hypothetical protein
MSNVALFNPGAVPAFAKARGELSAMAKALAGGGAGGKRVSIKGGVFRLINNGKEVAAIDERYLDVVVVNAAPKISRIFYLEKYDSENPAPPDCWSADGVTSSPDSENRQSVNCSECLQNIAGSGQGSSRACRYQQRLAVVLANDQEGDVLQLALPATSIFGKEEGDNRPLQAYARWLAAQNIDPSEVVTRMKFDTTSESPKLHFKAMRWLTDDEYPNIKEQGQSDDAIKAVTMTVAKMDNVTKPVDPSIGGTRPSASKAKAEEAPAAAVEDEDEDEAPPPPPKAKAKAKPKATPVEAAAEEAAEPVVRKEEKKPNAVPAAKSNLAAMVDDWDVE